MVVMLTMGICEYIYVMDLTMVNNELDPRHLGFGREVIRLRRVAKEGSCWLLGGAPPEAIVIMISTSSDCSHRDIVSLK